MTVPTKILLQVDKMMLKRSIKNQKDFFYHWKSMAILIFIAWWYIFDFDPVFLVLALSILFLIDLLPGLFLIYNFKKQSPFSHIHVNHNYLELYNDSGTLASTIHADHINKMIGYKPGSHPSHGRWFPFVACSFGFQHVEVELHDGRVLNITSLYNENIDAIIKRIKPEVYEEKMGVPYIRRENTFP